MNTVTVTAKRWSGGWELWHGDDCWTQVRHLRNAPQQVRDYLDTVHPETDHSDVQVRVVAAPEFEYVKEARQASDAAKVAAIEASAKTRAAVRMLLGAGVSATDAAVLMGLTKGRVSQLASERTNA